MDKTWRSFFAHGGFEAIWMTVLALLVFLPLAGAFALKAWKIDHRWQAAIAEVDRITPVERNGKYSLKELHLVFAGPGGKPAQAMVEVSNERSQAVGQNLAIHYNPEMPVEIDIDPNGVWVSALGAVGVACSVLAVAAIFALRGWVFARREAS